MAKFHTPATTQASSTPVGTQEVINKGGRLTFVYQVSRITTNSEGELDQLVLREYFQPRDQKVKALARYYFNWDVPSVSGMAVAHQYQGDTMYTVDLERNNFFKVILPLTKWDNELRRQLKPHKGKLMNPKVDAKGVSKMYGVQLHIEVEGNPLVSVERSEWDGNSRNWEIYQFLPAHIKSVTVVSAVEDKFLLPFLKGEEVDFLVAMETKKKRRRGKNSKDYRNREELEAKREELREAIKLKEEVKASSNIETSSIQKEINRLEEEIQSVMTEIESMI